MKRLFMSMLGAAVLAGLLLGCSTAAMKANPLSGPSADRVNIWPFYFYGNGAWSLLWPFVAVNNEGSAVVPLYEHDAASGELRVLSAHQALPAGAEFAPDYTRVFNVIRDKRATNKLSVLPLYFQNFTNGEAMFIPLMFKDKDGIWTPLFTKTKRLVGVLGPAINRYEGNRATYYNFPWPLVGFKTGGQQGCWALPAFYYGRNGQATHVNVGGVLLNLQKEANSWDMFYAGLLGGAGRESNGDGHNYLLPLWAWWKNESGNNFLSLPFSKYTKDGNEVTDALLNGFIQVRDKRTNDLYQSVFWPLFHRADSKTESGNALLPVYWYHEEKGGKKEIYSLPFNYRSDGSLLNVLGPAYYHSAEGDNNYTAVAWPLFHRFEDGKKTSNMVLPVYLYRKDKGGNTDFYSVLFNYKSDGTLLNVLGPAYYHQVDGKGDQYSSVMWPIAQAWTGKNGDKSSAVLPLFYEKREADGGRVLVSPLGWKSKDDFEQVLDIGGPLYYSKTDSQTGKAYHSVAWPLFHTWSERGGNRETMVLPLFFLNQHGGSRDFISLPVSFGKDSTSHYLNFGGLLYHQKTEGDRTKGFALAKLVGWDHHGSSEATRLHLIPVFISDWDKNSRRFISLPVSFGKSTNSHFLNLGGVLFHRGVEGDRHSGFALANIIGWNHSKKAGDTAYHIFPVFGVTDNPDYRQVHSMINGSYKNKKGEDTLRAEWLDPSLSPGKDNLSYRRGTKLNGRHVLFFMYNHSDWLFREVEPLAAGAAPTKGAREVVNTGGRRAQAIVRKEGETIIPLLGWHSDTVEGKSTDSSVLWRLYDSKSEVQADGSTNSRRRVLWHVFYREQKGDAVAADMFPFISWDDDPKTGTDRFTFAGGLVGGGKKDGKPYTQILWIKF